MNVVVLLNSGAGALATQQNQAQFVREEFEAVGVQAQVRALRGSELARAARGALAEGYDAIVVGGGDGSVSSVAGVMAGQTTPMGILPLGTLNHFARDLGIPVDLSAAARLVAQGKARGVDVAEVNGRVFINNSSIGIYPEVVRQRESQRERLGRGKWMAMFFAIVQALRRFPVLHVRVVAEGNAAPRRTPFVFVGNNRYEMDLFSIGGRTALDRGELSLYIAHRTGRVGMLKLAVRAIFGRLEQAEDFDQLYPREVWIETAKRHLTVALDGEVARLAPPLRYRIRPAELRVILPE